MRTEKVYACDFGDPESVRVRGGVKEAAKAIVRARESFWRGARVIERGWAGLCCACCRALVIEVFVMT